MAYKNSCPTLKKVSDEEPIFVLRAQDISAPKVILYWIAQNPQASEAKLQEALKCAKAMKRWPRRKVAD